MPVFKKKTQEGKENEWYIDIPNSGGHPPVYTIRVRDEGRDMLLDLDLNHADQPNREADIEWDLFYALDDLDLLYTYNTDYESDDAIPGSETFKQLSELSSAQRARFASSLLDKYEPDHLFQREQILRFFLSLDELDESVLSEVLDRVLEVRRSTHNSSSRQTRRSRPTCRLRPHPMTK